MASELKVDKFTGVTTAGSILVTGEGNSTTTNLQQGLAKHWCKFNGTGTVAVLDSFNNSSLADNGTGLYTLTITNDFANVNYTSVDGGIFGVGGGSSGATGIANPYNAENTGTLAIACRYGNDSGALDYARVMINCHGDLA